MDLNSIEKFYKSQLLDNIIPFWMDNSLDEKYGGYFSCLNRDGEVYDTDKFIWLQGRQVWTFAMLYNQVAQNQEWLDFARRGADFMIKHGRDKQGNWYFSLNREGQPLIQPYNIFADCFAAMAFGQLYKATNDSQYAEIAKNTFDNILKRQDKPKGLYTKNYPGTRDLQSFALPMILSNLVLEIEHILDQGLVEETINHGIDMVTNKFYEPQLGLILENINTDGSLSDSFEGRLINPGHGLESMWFIMDLAEKKDDKALMEKAVKIALQLINYGWDKDYGGIFYFMDRKGFPPQQLEWDQKLWWVHIEAMIAMLKGYLHTGNEQCLNWFGKIHDYSWKHFGDDEFGEWYGYIKRKGDPLVPSKGGKWKGCFHVPRGFYQLWKTAQQINQEK